MAVAKALSYPRRGAQARASGHEADPLDAHVGARMRLRRMALGISQSSLADYLGLTFQQIQKYESGGNRVSASKLYRAAAFMSCPVSYFFEGLARPDTDQSSEAHRRAELILSSFLSKPEGLELAVEFPKIPSRRLRQQIVRLVRLIAEEGEADDKIVRSNTE